MVATVPRASSADVRTITAYVRSGASTHPGRVATDSTVPSV
jgi:hypothetical protein